MAPALICLHNFKPGEMFLSTFTRDAEAMHAQSALYSRSTTGPNTTGGSGGVDTSTIIFIVVGVACLLALLIGFYLVGRHRAASNPSPSAASANPQHSAITHPPRPRRECGMSEYWNIWRIWRNTSSTNPLITVDTPTSQVPVTITSPSPTISTRGDCGVHPLVGSRPSQSRRITSLSVTTTFSHSHITEEELNNFRLSAYDLDGDLEAEMLNSATDDVWSGQPLAMEEGCGGAGAEEAAEVRSNATSTVEGSVEGDVPLTTQRRGGDYENTGACESVASAVATALSET